MTLRASLFNKGIYKSTLRRYVWGSVLYFILLFMMTGMSILLTYSNQSGYVPMFNGRKVSLVLNSEYLLLPILLSVVVPTVTGLLIFRFVHSKKTSVFVHSLPVKRTENYVSSVLAGLTLMIAPLILNTGVLMVISASGYGELFSPGDALVWLFLNIFSIFIMFSCVCFVALLTGNSFAMIVLNVIFHAFIPLLTAGLSIVCETFLHGFAGEDTLLRKVAENNFPARMVNIGTTWNYGHINAGAYIGEFIKFGIIAVFLYIISALFYKKRAMEKAEDVAGFNCLNPILKYLMTFMGAIVAFSIFSNSIDENEFVFWCLVALISAVIYFASEMLLKKSFKVWRSYKGYVIFAAVFTLLMYTFSMTSFFGFERNIPAKEEISKVSAYDYYGNERPFIANEDIIDRVLNIHGKLIVNPPRIKTPNETAIHLEYELKGGRTIHRRYAINEDELHEIMNSLYQNEEYKMKREAIFEKSEEIYRININHNYGSEEISDKEKLSALYECIKADVSELSYNALYNNGWNFNIELNFIVEEEGKEEYYNTIQSVNSKGERIRIKYLHLNINPNYKRTVEWIKKNGYWDMVKIENEGCIYICKEWEALPFVKEERGEASSKKENKGFIKLEKGEETQRVIDYVLSAPQEYLMQEERYSVYQIKDEENKDYLFLSNMKKEEIKALFPEKDFE